MKWNYLFKHWVSTILLAPLLYFIYNFIVEELGFTSTYYEEYILFIVFGFHFSIPTFIVYSLAFYFLRKYKVSLKKAKTLLISITLIGILLSFYVVFEASIFQLEASLFVLEISYILISIGTGLLFSLHKKHH